MESSDAKSVRVRRIKEDADYEGVRARFLATLSGARITMQIDVGFGDVVYPAPKPVHYPTILDFPAPVLAVTVLSLSSLKSWRP